MLERQIVMENELKHLKTQLEEKTREMSAKRRHMPENTKKSLYVETKLTTKLKERIAELERLRNLVGENKQAPGILKKIKINPDVSVIVIPGKGVHNLQIHTNL